MTAGKTLYSLASVSDLAAQNTAASAIVSAANSTALRSHSLPHNLDLDGETDLEQLHDPEPAVPPMQPAYEDFAAGLKKLYGSGGVINFGAFAGDTAHLCVDAPVVRFMLGSLTVVKKEPKQKAAAAQRQKRQNVADAAAAAGEIVHVAAAEFVDKKAEALNSKRPVLLWNELRELEKAKERVVRIKCADGISRTLLPLLGTLVDPWSYSQTIEHLFYFSSLVKDGLAGVYMAQVPAKIGGDAAGGDDDDDDEGGGGQRSVHPYARFAGTMLPFIRPMDEDEVMRNRELSGAAAGDHEDEDAHSGSRSRQARERSARALMDHSHQVVFQLDMDSWKRIVKKFSIREPALRHRKSRDTDAPAGYRFFVDVDDLAVAATAAAGGSGFSSSSNSSKRNAKPSSLSSSSSAAAKEEERDDMEDDSSRYQGNGAPSSAKKQRSGR